VDNGNNELRGAEIGIIGWDIGGVHIKISWMETDKDSYGKIRVASRPFEIWRDKDRLPAVLREAFADVYPDSKPEAMAVTMSAELSDVFASKREGVLFVLDSVRSCFPDVESFVLNVSGDFVPLEEARTHPMEFAAANWMASAKWFARNYPDCLLVDVGSTTTDILPILEGKVRVSGRTDTERLLSGELVYTGALRTNLAAIVQSVPIGSRSCRVASEYFTVSGDIHLILGHISPREYTCTTPDGRPPTVESARNRLARLVCADAEMLPAADIDAIALYIHKQQVLQIRSGLEQVIAVLPVLQKYPVVVYGLGAFLGLAAAESLGLKIDNVKSGMSPEISATLPSVAAASLLASCRKREP
jgi:probable H4MPT-linked C1 transfer pathway protein